MTNTNHSEDHYFYLWRHCYVDDITDAVITRTCFGITSNLDKRQNGYEGHVGHAIKWAGTWSGPERQIRELEQVPATRANDLEQSDVKLRLIQSLGGYRG